MEAVRILTSSGTSTTWILFCPGCRELHPLETPRWSFNGDVARPTFHPSLVVRPNGHDRCHSWIRDGQIQFLADSHHDLAGMTVALPDVRSA